MKSKLAIWGTSGHASVVANIVRLQGQYEVVGFLNDVNPDLAGTTFCGAPVLGSWERLGDLRRQGVGHLIVGFGACKARLELGELLVSKGFELATAIHPSAVVEAAGVKVGAGTVVAAGAVVNPGARIGENVIINTCASVDHDSIVQDGAHISPGAHLAGAVSVGRGAWVGLGAVVTGNTRIGAESIIGAGAVVVKDVPDGVVAYGVPARVARRVGSDD